jgi:hypothetical protein
MVVAYVIHWNKVFIKLLGEILSILVHSDATSIPSGAISADFSGMPPFLQESVGHDKVLNIEGITTKEKMVCRHPESIQSPSGLCRRPGGVQPEYVGECKVLSSSLRGGKFVDPFLLRRHQQSQEGLQVMILVLKPVGKLSIGQLVVFF